MAALARQTFALAAGSREARLFRVSAAAELELLAAFPGPATSPATFSGLAEALAGCRGRLHVSLPLFAFETATIDLPITNREAVAKALPYHLGKTLARPLGDFVYDWQIVRSQKDSSRIAVFLLPAVIEQGIRKALAASRVRLAAIEPDIFSIFAHAGRLGLLPGEGSILGLIVHDNFIVQGFYEEGRLRLVREVKLPVPDAPFSPEEISRAGIPAARDADVLSAFALTSREDETPAMEPETEAASPWLDYFEQVGLELVRGRDYYASIMKGAAPERVFLAGDGPFLDTLAGKIGEYGEMSAAVLALPQAAGGGLVGGLAAGAAAGDSGLERVNLAPAPDLGQRMKRAPLFIAAGVAIVLALLFAAEYLHTSRNLARERARLAAAARRAEAARLLTTSRARLVRGLKKAEEQRKGLEKELAPLRNPPQGERALAPLIAAVGRALPVRARCDKITLKDARLVIRGRAVDHDTVERFTEGLRRISRLADIVLEEVRRNDRAAAPLDFRISCAILRQGGEP